MIDWSILCLQQLGHTQLAIDQHKNKSMTLQDQILQLKFAMEKAQQNEVNVVALRVQGLSALYNGSIITS